MTTRFFIIGMIAITFLAGGSIVDAISMTSPMRAPGRQEVDLSKEQTSVQLNEKTANQELPVPLTEIDAYIERAMETWNVPGLAIALVKDDQVVFSKGYGVRDVGSGEPVDVHTRFAIGSTTKAFTAAALGRLVDNGDMEWDDLVIDYLPDFRLFDPWVTRYMTVRDLLTHRSGLERGDLLWYAGHYDREEIIRRLRYLRPTLRFREQFGYQNIMYAAAGQIVEAITGTSWSSYVRQQFLTPLHMFGSTTSAYQLSFYENVATPHYEDGDQLHTTPHRVIDTVAPAGSINSNVNDMAKWVRLQLTEGLQDGERFLSENSVREMHSPQTIIPRSPLSQQLIPETHFTAYGLGWILNDYHGRMMVSHGGNIDGMSALVSMVPEEELGLVILTNMDATPLPDVISRWIIDRFLNVPDKDWSQIFYDTLESIGEQIKFQLDVREKERAEDTAPSLPLERYRGIYESEFYGEAIINSSDDGLVFSFGSLTGVLSHWHYDTFEVHWNDPYLQSTTGTYLIHFRLDARGRVESMTGQDLLEQYPLDDFLFMGELEEDSAE